MEVEFLAPVSSQQQSQTCLGLVTPECFDPLHETSENSFKLVRVSHIAPSSASTRIPRAASRATLQNPRPGMTTDGAHAQGRAIGLTDLLNIELYNDSFKEFTQAWEEMWLLSLDKGIDEEMLENLYEKQLRKSSLMKNGSSLSHSDIRARRDRNAHSNATKGSANDRVQEARPSQGILWKRRTPRKPEEVHQVKMIGLYKKVACGRGKDCDYWHLRTVEVQFSRPSLRRAKIQGQATISERHSRRQSE